MQPIQQDDVNTYTIAEYEQSRKFRRRRRPINELKASQFQPIKTVYFSPGFFSAVL
jgi:hypothetical protein